MVQVLLPIGGDPHSYQPTPQDLAAIEDAQLMFINGFDLEEALGTLIENSADPSKIIEVSDGIDPLYFGEHTEEHENNGEEDHHDAEEGAPEDDGHEDEGHPHEGVDPHVWMDPLTIHVWVENIAGALISIDPDNAADYQANAQAYRQELDALHQWALAQFAAVPEEQRLLVSDHETFNYLAQAYGLDVVGALTGFSSLSESSAQELAALEDAIRELGVPAIFVSTTVPPGLAERVAADTGVQVVRVYTGSLSGPDGPAASYLEMMRYNISQISGALQ
jgi:ABC-type Zn uptake system ZnuABC Zn-binding protein ZnuA